MARQKTIWVATDGRDAGKEFELTEMAADQAEWWAWRAGRALAVSGVQLPENWENATMAQIAILGLGAVAALPEHDLKALLDEMFTCVKYKAPNAKVPPQPIIEGAGSQIEEVKTRWALRQQLWYMHTGFSQADASPTTG